MNALTQAHLDPRLIFELAAQVERPEVIALNYDMEPTYLVELMESTHVKRLIREKKAELDKTGYALATKAKLCFEDLLGDVYTKAKGVDATLNGVMEAAKFFRTVAGLDKPETAGPGEKFSINIQLSASGTANIQVSTGLQRPVEPITLDMEDFELPARPSYLKDIFVEGNALSVD
jgi:hypothetical protein